jgi:acyl carrier protein
MQTTARQIAPTTPQLERTVQRLRQAAELKWLARPFGGRYFTKEIFVAEQIQLGLNSEYDVWLRGPLLLCSDKSIVKALQARIAGYQHSDTPQECSEIFEGLKQIIQDITGVDPSEITPDKLWGDHLGVDFVDLNKIAAAAEDKWSDIYILEQDLPRLDTVGKLVAYIEFAIVGHEELFG